MIVYILDSRFQYISMYKKTLEFMRREGMCVLDISLIITCQTVIPRTRTVPSFPCQIGLVSADSDHKKEETRAVVDWRIGIWKWNAIEIGDQAEDRETLQYSSRRNLDLYPEDILIYIRVPIGVTLSSTFRIWWEFFQIGNSGYLVLTIRKEFGVLAHYKHSFYNKSNWSNVQIG